MLKLLSLLTGRKIVLLLDHQNQFYRTIESKKINPFTKTKYCYVYWFTKIGMVNMHEDGKTTGRSYIEKWAYE
jgi:hypothetical protein